MKKNYKTFFLSLLTSVICPLSSFSQTAPGIEWQKCLGGTSFDYGCAIKQTNDGGYIVAGRTESIDGDITINNGYRDAWIIKLDSLQNIVWQKCYGGSNEDDANDIDLSNDGGYFFGGNTSSIDGDVTGFHGGGDYWIVKIDSIGNIIWQNCFGGFYDDEMTSLQKTTDGGCIVSGYSKSDDGDVTGHHGLVGVFGASDMWIVKLDNNGIIEWQKSLGGSGLDEAMSVQQTNEGGYIVVGNSLSIDGDVTGNHGNRDFWIVKLDTAGNLIWQKCLGGSSGEYGNSIKQINNSGYIVIGSSGSSDGDATFNHGWADLWTVEIDSIGNVVWQKSFGGSMWDGAFDVAITNDGKFIAAGSTISNDGDVSGNNGYEDYWIIKFDTASLIWQKPLGGTNQDRIRSTEITQDEGYIVIGRAGSNDGMVMGNHGIVDCWIVKLFPDTITGISQLPQLPNYPITISPNPLTTQSKLTFKNLNKEKFLFTLYDITGRITESVSTTNNEIILTKGRKQPGGYLFNLMNEKTGERWNGKIIISN